MSEVLAGKKAKYHRNTFDAKTFVGSSTAFFGTSGTGKSFLLNEYISQLHDQFYMAIIFTGTGETDRYFPMEKYTPYPCIYSTLDIAKIKQIMEASEKTRIKYLATRNLERLRPAAQIALKIVANNRQLYTELRSLIAKIHKFEKENIDGEMDDKNARFRSEDKAVGLYRVIMLRTLNYIKERKIDISGYSVEDTLCITHVKMSCNLLMIFNDLGDEIGELNKADKGVIESLYNKGRHFGITPLLLLQNIGQVSKAARKSIKNCIFTTPQAMNDYATNLSWKKAQNTMMADAVAAVFVDESHKSESEQEKNKLFFNNSTGIFQFVRASRSGIQHMIGDKKVIRLLTHCAISQDDRLREIAS